jgi:hypothetical protein
MGGKLFPPSHGTPLDTLAEAVATIAVEEKAVVDSGTELIVTIEDHMGIETIEKIIRKTTQEVLNIRIIFRIF